MSSIIKTTTKAVKNNASLDFQQSGNDFSTLAIKNCYTSIEELYDALEVVPQKVDIHGKVINPDEKVKFRPLMEQRIIFDITLEDGTKTSLEGSLSLWLNRNHVSSVMQEGERIKEQKAKDILTREQLEERKALLSNFTPEQIAIMAKMGMKV